MQVELLHRQPPGAESARLVRWCHPVGATVAIGEPLLELEIDKTEVVVDSPHAGMLVEVTADVGDELLDGDLLAVFETEP